MAQWDAKDKTFLITGGASGLGARYAEAFLNEGAKNVAILDIAEDLGKATAERLNKVHRNKAVFIKCDMSKEEDITSAFDSVLAQFKQIDVIVNNAGVMVDAPNIWRTASVINWNVAILDIAEELGKATAERLNKVHRNKAVFIKCDMSKEEDITSAFDSVLAQFKQIDVIVNNAGVMVDAPNIWRTASVINWQGVVSLTLKGVKFMRRDEGGVGGTIINIASTAALNKFPCVPIYSGSKMAVLHFSQCLAMDPFYDNTGVRVLTLCLGATDTSLLHNLELRSYEPKMGKFLADLVMGEGFVCQKPASAVAAVLEMFKTGPPASIWLAKENKPAKNITPVIDGAFKDFENIQLQ